MRINLKIILLTDFLLSLSLWLTAQAPASARIRELFREATTDQCKASVLYESIPSAQLNNNALLMAYKGAARAMMADCVFSPVKKQAWFNEAKPLIEGAVNLQKNSIEIRFLRFIIQSHLPVFLKYDNMKEDKDFLFRAIPEQYKRNVERNYLLEVCNMMVASGKLSEAEKKRLLDSIH